MFDQHFDPVVLRLIGILRKALPGVSEEDIFWGYHFVTGSFYVSNWGINNNGQVILNAKLDNGNQGVYTWQNGTLSLVAKTGRTILRRSGEVLAISASGSLRSCRSRRGPGLV